VKKFSNNSHTFSYEFGYAMRGIVRELYKRLLFTGRSYPQGLDYIRIRVKAGDTYEQCPPTFTLLLHPFLFLLATDLIDRNLLLLL
jgi:hypothetical protein